MKLLLFIITCFSGAATLCLTNQAVDQSQYFPCTIINNLDNEFPNNLIPRKIFFAFQHPNEKGIFRFLSQTEYCKLTAKLDELSSKAQMIPRYNLKARLEFANEIMKLGNLHYVFLFDDNKYFAFSDGIGSEQTVNLARRFLFNKIDESHKELNKERGCIPS